MAISFDLIAIKLIALNIWLWLIETNQFGEKPLAALIERNSARGWLISDSAAPHHQGVVEEGGGTPIDDVMDDVHQRMRHRRQLLTSDVFPPLEGEHEGFSPAPLQCTMGLPALFNTKFNPFNLIELS